MIKEFINAWGTNKDALRDYIKITPLKVNMMIIESLLNYYSLR